MIFLAYYPKIMSQNEKKKMCLNILKFYPIRAFKQLGPVGNPHLGNACYSILLVMIMTIKDWDGHPFSVTAFSQAHIQCI